MWCILFRVTSVVIGFEVMQKAVAHAQRAL
jgi:hypothetical protein